MNDNTPEQVREWMNRPNADDSDSEDEDARLYRGQMGPGALEEIEEQLSEAEVEAVLEYMSKRKCAPAA